MNIEELKDLENSNLAIYRNPAELRKLLRQVVAEWESLEGRNRALMDEFERMKVTYISPKGSVKEALEVFSKLDPRSRQDVWGAEIDKIMEAQRVQLTVISQLAEVSRQTLLAVQILKEKHDGYITEQEWEDACEQVRYLSSKESELFKEINLSPEVPQSLQEVSPDDEDGELDSLFG